MMPAHVSVIDLTESDQPAQPVVPLAPAVAIDQLLRDTIEDAHEARVRHALQTVCETSPEASKIVQELLLVPADKVKARVVCKDYNSDPAEGEEEENSDQCGECDSSDDRDEDESPIAQGQGILVSVGQSLKRVRPRFANCENCDEEFDVGTNSRESCIFHPGTIDCPCTLSPMTMMADLLQARAR